MPKSLELAKFIIGRRNEIKVKETRRVGIAGHIYGRLDNPQAPRFAQRSRCSVRRFRKARSKFF